MSQVPLEEDPTLALQQAKTNNKLLFVLCESANLVLNSNHRIRTNSKLVSLIQSESVWLHVQEGTMNAQHFTAIYPVREYPALFCIDSRNGQVLNAWFGEDLSMDETKSETLCNGVEWMIVQWQDFRLRSNLNTMNILANTSLQSNDNPIYDSVNNMYMTTTLNNNNNNNNTNTEKEEEEEEKKKKERDFKDSKSKSKLEELKKKSATSKTKSERE